MRALAGDPAGLWGAFDGALQRARGRELRKGPRGGDKNVDRIVDHVLEADRAYLARLNWEHKRLAGSGPQEELEQPREAVLEPWQLRCVKGYRSEGRGVE